MPIKVEIDPDQLVKKTADGKGRVYLGKEYQGKDVELLILEDNE